MKEMTARRDVLMQNLRLETSSRIAKDKVSLSLTHIHTPHTHAHIPSLSLSLFHTNTNMCCRKQWR